MEEPAPKKPLAIRSQPVAAEERERAIAFLRREGYSREISENDQFFVAEIAEEIVGAVRLSREDGVLVLRGMRILEEIRRQRVGTRLLRALISSVRSETCYCIPYRWLISFYAQADFREVPEEETPVFLARRRTQYTNEGLDVLVMRRQPH